MKKLSNLFSMIKDWQLLVWLIIAVWSVWTAYYWMVTKIDVLTVKVDQYATTQQEQKNKLDWAIVVRDYQHEIINSKLTYIMPTLKSLAITHNLPIYEQ